ncbi:hypothetical protein ACFO5K_14910 [Nocardia halotolerans]|uniref:Uncharacterized protein n=1 Tax=Nocardia halotolerans TaxID=1755878 RepID=A0ABV8VH89_9NOCA
MSESTAYTQLLSQVRAGEVYLDNEAAAYYCYKACDKRILDLENMLTLARNVQNVSGFGDFHMGRDLEQKFLKQATGEPNSIDAVIHKDIEVVQELREVFAISFQRITGQDVDSANALDYTTEQLG